MTKTKFEDIIAREGRLVYTNVGDSMYPTIQPRDLLVISRVEKPMERYDIPLYKRDNGAYVLHRIVGIEDGGYIMCGDNRCCPERGITDRHIIGVLTAIVRNGETIPVTTPKKTLWMRSITYRKLLYRLRKYSGWLKS